MPLELMILTTIIAYLVDKKIRNVPLKLVVGGVGAFLATLLLGFLLASVFEMAESGTEGKKWAIIYWKNSLGASIGTMITIPIFSYLRRRKAAKVDSNKNDSYDFTSHNKTFKRDTGDLCDSAGNSQNKLNSVKDVQMTDLNNLNKENNTAERKTTEIESTTDSIKNNYKNAELAIEYRQDIRIVSEVLEKFPQQIMSYFLEILDLNPKISTSELKNKIYNRFIDWFEPNDYSNTEANKALSMARVLGPEAEQELTNMIDLLGEELDFSKTLRTIKEKCNQSTIDSKNIYLNRLDSIEKYIEYYQVNNVGELMQKLNIKFNQDRKTKGGYGYVLNDQNHSSLIDAVNIAHSNDLSLVDYYKMAFYNYFYQRQTDPFP